MDKKAILAIVLSLVVVVIWSLVFAPRSPEPGDTPEIVSPALQKQQATRPVVASRPASPLAPDKPAVMSTGPETEITVDTGVTRLLLTNRGAGVRAVQLLDFHVSLDKDALPIEIAPTPGTTAIPLATQLQTGQQVIPLGDVSFELVTTSTDVVLSAQHAEDTVTFRSQLPNGWVVHRQYYFRHNSYAFDVSTWIEGLPSGPAHSLLLQWGPGLLEATDTKQRRGETAVQPRSYVGGKVLDEVPEQAGQTLVQQGPVAWAALGNTYFAAVLLPQQPGATTLEVSRTPSDALTVGVRTSLNGAQEAQEVRIYVGPKRQPLLIQVDPSLDKLIDLGFFAPMARPMMALLRWVNGLMHNYGVSIIIVTILLKIVLWPLTQKSFKSMQGMQKLQPKMKELQTMYKDDRQGLNRAMMALYRERGINPMGGCLPMVLQIPIFIAFYNALLYAVELRHAPFICWENEIIWGFRGICDLSVRDPSYITPILMGVSMFLQQRMTPTTGDPTQAKMMQFMPLIFLFFFLSAPAGLVLYWLVNNVLSIFQQMLINRMRQAEEAKAAA